MDIYSSFAFASAVFLLAASPGPGLAAVLSRCLVSGFSSGIAVVVGFLLVDFLFLCLAILGVSAIASTLGPVFHLFKWIAAAYLIWLGFGTLKNAKKMSGVPSRPSSTYRQDVGLGAIVTLGNPKAILFYGALLPTFFEISQIRVSEFVALCAIISVVSFLVYGIYMSIFLKSQKMFETTKFSKRIQQASGCLFMGSGVAVALR
ncbi:MAG: LysE family translocator [Pseudomonadota bacterium]